MKLLHGVVSGVKWSAASRAGEQLAATLSTVVLAWLLDPAAFGVLGMAAVAIGFVTLVADLGMPQALVHREDSPDEFAGTLFWLALAFGVVGAIALYVAAPAVGAAFREPRVVPVLRALAPASVLQAIASVPTALLTRELAFDRLAKAQLAAHVAGGAVGVAMALVGFGVWSLVGQQLVRAGVEAFGVMLAARFRPPLEFRREAAESALSYGLSLTGFNVTAYLVRNVDNVLIGRFLGPTALGLYDVAWRLIQYPVSALSSVVGRVIFPALARMQDDLARMREAYLRACAAISLLTVPMLLGLAALAEPFVLAVLGPRWEDAVLLVALLAPVGLAQSVGSTTGQVYAAVGRTHRLLWWGLFAGATTAVAMAAGLRWGVVGVAAARLMVNTALLPLNLWLAFRLVGGGVPELARRVAPVAAAGGVMAVGVVASRLAVDAAGWGAPFAVLVIGVATGAGIYAAALWRVRPRALYETLAALALADVAWARPWALRLRPAED